MLLFVSHDATRTGAPIVLLRFLDWMKRKVPTLPFRIILRRDGALRPDFEALAPTQVWPGSGSLSLVSRARNSLQCRKLVRDLARSRVRLIYSNTVTNGRVVSYLSRLGCPVITHAHELEHVICNGVGREEFENVLGQTHHFVAVSDAVRRNLTDCHNVDPCKVSLVHEMIDGAGATAAPVDQRQRLLISLGLRADARIVMASGTADWRKGADLFIHLARHIYERFQTRRIYFVWVGAQADRLEAERRQFDLAKLGLAERVIFTGEVKNPLEYYALADVFAVLSREDPFPLVMLEAGSIGKPIVCFASSGGAEEFVAGGCGIAVPYLNIPALAEAVLSLMSDEPQRSLLGRAAAQKVGENHVVDVLGPRLLSLIQRFVPAS